MTPLEVDTLERVIVTELPRWIAEYPALHVPLRLCLSSRRGVI
ncbi:MAG TPA: hypothetical protein PLJ78_00245 [Anaerolineae bacterium]|nr:hypothetical protein [Anaerolineae bacterium]HQK12357.1 hypothetical protein [Anaerolineae bacterium]